MTGVVKKIIIILSALFISNLVIGQIVLVEKTYPGIRVIKTKQFGGSGGKGYWNYKYLDKKGRIILEEKYKKKELLAVYIHRYDEYNNKISSTTVYDINYPNGGNPFSESQYFYKYNNEGNVFELRSLIGQSNIVKKINRQLDNVKFEIIEINMNSHSGNTKIDTTLSTVELDNYGKIKRKIENQAGNIGNNTTDYIYFENGELKRRIITRDPKPDLEIVYTGWPGSDDMSWVYKYDKDGRIKTLYSIVKGRKTKLEEYKYEKW